MKPANLLLTALTLCCSVGNAATEANFEGNTLFIPHAVFNNKTYEVEMTLHLPNKLKLSKATALVDDAPSASAVYVSDDLSFGLTDILIGQQRFRADVAFVEGGDFQVTGVTLVDAEAIFDDSLNIAYYNLDNPKTGNDQLVVYDAVTKQHLVVKEDVILGRNNFVFGGNLEGDKTVYQSRKYGIFLDPSKENEPRTAPDGRGGQFEYAFYFDNAFKRYDITNPASESLIFDANMLSQSLKDQGLKVMQGEYQLFNTITDPDNSYVEIKSFEKLPDLLRGESASTLLHAPILIRLFDGKYTNAHFVATLKNPQGIVTNVLAFHDAVHKKGVYPEGDANRQRLQLCTADLGQCRDVGNVGSEADGGFYYQTETNQYIYLTKQGSRDFFALNKESHALEKVSGAQYPAVFDHKRHVVASDLGHGGEVDTLSNFSSLSGMKVSLAEGADGFLAINYDLDNQDPVGSYKFLGDIHIYKHSQIIKFSGLVGTKMFDNGDGIDHGDESDAEKAVGHINLIAVANNRLLVEIGNYDGESALGSCQPDENGYYCSSLRYGYLDTQAVAATTLGAVLYEMPNLKFFTARRIAPFAMNDKLYISLLAIEAARGGSHQYSLHAHELSDLGEASETTGRVFVTRTAKRANGINEGDVIAWDGATNKLVNLTRNILLGNVNDSTSSAIASTFGRTAGIPLAGIGNLYALRADPGGHQWYLIAGETDKENGLETVDHVPFSSWLYQ